MGLEIKYHRLANNLLLIGELCAERQSSAIGFFVKTGARDENHKESGLSHFLEHMMFKGTSKRSALELNFELGNIGAQANAFTSEENTVYYAGVLPEYFSRMQEVLCDMLRPSLDEGEFRTEKKVILEEIALYQDRPQFFLMEKALKEYYAQHPAGNSVLGTNESVGALEPEDMRSYFGRRYVPSNMALVAAGAFDWDRFVEDAERYCAGWKDATASRVVSDYVGSGLKKVYHKKFINQAHVLLVNKGVSAQADERHAICVLSHILGDSSGSKLYWELVDKGLAESVGVDSDERDGTGLFLAYASSEPENMDHVVEVCRKVLAKPLDFSKEELERAKAKILSGMVLNGELPMGRLMSLGSDWSYRHTSGLKIETLAESIAHIKAVTREQVEAALSKLSLANWSEFRLLPE